MTAANYLGNPLVLLVIIFSSDFSASLYQRPCQDLSSECITKTIQSAIPNFVRGFPEYGLETLDPYYIDKLDMAMPGDMVIHFVNGRAKGLRNCIVDHAKLEGNILEAQYHCNLVIRGKYRSKGRMLLFPIDGVGDSTIKCHNLRINSALNLGSKIGDDGQKYLEIRSYNITHNYDGKVSYNMTNLFKGNPEINNAILDFMNNNWRMIAEEFGTPMVDYGVNCVMKNLKQLVKVLPLDYFTAVPIGF